jgi:hypothetical protein
VAIAGSSLQHIEGDSESRTSILSMTSNRAEREPLIAKPQENAGSCSIERDDARHDTPLPIGQLAVLSLVRVAEPINFTMIFPFVNQVGSVSFCPSAWCPDSSQMMLELKVTDQPSEIGFYSGLVVRVLLRILISFYDTFHRTRYSQSHNVSLFSSGGGCQSPSRFIVLS